MTPISHNRTLAILHLAYAGLMTLLMGGMSILMLAMFSVPIGNGEPVPAGFLVFVAIVMLAVTLVHGVPSFLAGYALLKHKRWARTMTLVAAIVAGLNFPLGSALCVFTLYFLFGESGRFLYPQSTRELPSGNAEWASTAGRELEREYVPPATPPDWR